MRNHLLYILIAIILILGAVSLIYVKRIKQAENLTFGKLNNSITPKILLSVTPTPSCPILPTCIPADGSCSINQTDKYCQVSAEWIVENYFNQYLFCLQNPPLAAAANVRQYCATHNRFAGSKLADSVRELKETENKIITCSLEFPVGINNVKTKRLTAKKAEIILTYKYTDDTLDALYTVEKENNEWKIVDINCEPDD